MNYAETHSDDRRSGWVRSSGGLFVPEAAARKRPIAVDLFCGCGGFSLGIIHAGFEVVAAVDNDPMAALTYLMNLGAYPLDLHFVTDDDRRAMEKRLRAETKATKAKRGRGESLEIGLASGGNRPPGIPGVSHFWLGDIRRLSGQEILGAIGVEKGQVDLVVGGPPCQGFSVAGKHDVLDPRNSLVFEFARLVLEIMPKAICMENVPNIVNMVTPEGLPVVEAFCRVLEDGNFGRFEAIKRALLASSGAGAALKGTAGRTGRRTRGKRKAVADESTTEQVALRI